MDFVHYTWVKEHVQYRLKGVREEMREFATEVGKITGTAEKEMALLRKEIESERRKLEALIEKQGNVIESQRRQIKSLEARLSRRRGKETAASAEAYRPRMGLLS